MLPEIHCQTRSLTPSVLLGEQLCSVLSGVPVSATIYPLSLVVGLMISVFILCTSITRFPWTTTWEKTACINQKVRWFYDRLSHTACPRKEGSALWLELHRKRMGGIGQLSLFLTVQQRRNEKQIKPWAALNQGEIANTGYQLLLI